MQRFGPSQPAVKIGLLWWSCHAAAYGCAMAGQVWPEELHIVMAETDKMLAGEAPVDLLRRGVAERVADLLLSLGRELPRFRLLH